ncbi:MAG: DUF2817 domain-containing protein [Candidatus Aminicenantes bacterium]|nr:DUF2817 domain-containing protein [Candidatus Aminicenantes bacterium]
MRRKASKSAVISLLLFICATTASLYAENIKTPAELSNYTQYSQQHDISVFLSLLSRVSPELRIINYGPSFPDKHYGPKDLYLCILTEEGIESPEKLNRNKTTIYIVAAKHGNEQSAKEAALRLIRDLANGELKPLLRQLNFLILPAANPYGNYFDVRRNGQDLDLNRDHVKMEAPETRAITRIFRQWMPEVTLDVHEKGDDYYRINIGCVSNANISADLQEFSRNILFPEIEQDLKERNFTFHEYLLTQQMGIDSSAGVTYSSDDMRGRERMMRYSTSDINDGRNAPGIYETLSFIQEGASRHDLETLQERTEWQYYGMRYFSKSIASHSQEINDLVRGLRNEVLIKAGDYAESDLVHLRMRYARDENQPTLTYKKFDTSIQEIWGIMRVDKKAGDPVYRKDIASPPMSIREGAIEETETNWFPLVEPFISVPRPLGYVVPGNQTKVIKTLLDHCLDISYIREDTLVEVESYQVIDITPAEYDYLPPQNIDVEKKKIEVLIKRGDFYISCDQEGANLIPCLLEPQSQYGLIRYWTYNLVPKKGDIFPFYRLIKKVNLPLIPFKEWN